MTQTIDLDVLRRDLSADLSNPCIEPALRTSREPFLVEEATRDPPKKASMGCTTGVSRTSRLIVSSTATGSARFHLTAIACCASYNSRPKNSEADLVEGLGPIRRWDVGVKLTYNGLVAEWLEVS